MKSLIAGDETICGEPEIWRLMTSAATVTGVQNIKWEKIDTLAADYISKQEALVTQLEGQLESLAARIKEKRESEQPQVASVGEVQGLIESAAVEFGGVDEAQRTKCGKPGIRPRGPRRAYGKSEAAFRSAAEKYFTGGMRLDGDAFLGRCEDLLPPGDGEDSYCGPLCQSFKDIAQELSDASAGETAGQTSSDLEKEETEKLEALSKAQQELGQCKHARASIEGFKTQLEGLSKDIKDRFDDLRAAEMALEDASWDLEDLLDDLAAAETELDKAVKVFEGAEAGVEDAKSSLQALQGEESALAEKVKESVQSLEAMKQRLKAAKNADKVVNELKSAVSMTAMKMQLFFDKAVGEPVRDVGLGEYVVFEEYFVKDPSTIQSAGSMREAVTSLDSFCKGEAKSAFDAVKSQVDLSPLCAIGETDAINSELGAAVTTRMNVLVEQMKKVQSWLDPYKGQTGMTAEKAQAKVDAGEPKGLREIMAVYSRTDFWKYLKEWELNGTFLALLDKLKELVGSLDASVQKLNQDLESLKEQVKTTMAARDLAEGKLSDATKAQGLAADKKAEMEKTVADLKDQRAKQEADVSRFLAEFERAKKMYEDAKVKLLAAHKEGTSLLEFMAEEDTSTLLKAESVQAQQQMSLLQDALRDARSHSDAIEARISEVYEAQRGP